MKLSIFYSLVFSFLIFNLANAENLLEENLLEEERETDTNNYLFSECDSYKDVSVEKINEIWYEDSSFYYEETYSYFDANGKFINTDDIPLACIQEIDRRYRVYEE